MLASFGKLRPEVKSWLTIVLPREASFACPPHHLKEIQPTFLCGAYTIVP